MVYENGSQGIKEKVGLIVRQENLVEDVKVRKEEKPGEENLLSRKMITLMIQNIIEICAFLVFRS
mgnify:CR=1 FL=1